MTKVIQMTTMTLEFKPAEELPPVYAPIMIYYHKGSRKSFGGETGNFYIQGFYNDVYDTWFDYTGRILSERKAKQSFNKIISWALLPQQF